MIIHDVVQGSPEWHEARGVMPTASNASKILTPAQWKPSKSQDTYLRDLFNVWIGDAPQKKFTGSFATERGHEFEAEAGRYFSLVTGIKSRSVGFITNDAGTMGCSPDLFDEPVEIKCLYGWTHKQYQEKNKELGRVEVPTEFLPQLHMSMVVTGKREWHFIAYHPVLRPIISKVVWNEKTDTMGEELEKFVVRLEEEKQRALEFKVAV